MAPRYVIEKFPQRSCKGRKWGLYAAPPGGAARSQLGRHLARKVAILIARLPGGRNATMEVVK